VSADGLIAYLQAQPDDFVINWYSDGMDHDHPYDSPWVDVMFEDHIAWTIVSGLDPDDSDNDLLWPPDLVAHILIDPTEHPGHARIGMIPTALGQPVDEDTLKEFRFLRSQASPEAFWLGAPAWSAAEVNRAIESWCMEHVGRVMQARWDAEHGPSPFHKQAMETMAAMQAGIEPKYLLHPGEAEGGTGYSVYASEQVMESLMQYFVDEEGE
jgi:hypothetical protein